MRAPLWSRLLPRQRDAVRFALSRPEAALFCEQGTGKTLIALATLEAEGKAVSALITCVLANLETTWIEKAREFTGLHVTADWSTFKTLPTPRVFLVHYEGIHKLIGPLSRHKWTHVIADESQKLMARGSRQSRMLARLRHVAHKIILSGTPIEKKPEDLYAQFRFLAPDVFGVKFAAFKARFLQKTGYMGYQLKMRPAMLPEFNRRIAPYCFHVYARDVFDSYEPILRRTTFKLGRVETALYRGMEKDSIANLNGEKLIAEFETTKLIRLQQITSGFIKDGERIMYVGQSKAAALDKLLGVLRKPVVVCCRWTEEINICEEVVALHSKRYAIIDGRNRKRRPQIQRDFQAGRLDFLIMQVKAGGVGLDLYASNVGVIYGTTWSYIDFDQFTRRMARYGQTRPVSIYTLEAEGTRDVAVFDALADKRNVSTALFKAIKKPR